MIPNCKSGSKSKARREQNQIQSKHVPFKREKAKDWFNLDFGITVKDSNANPIHYQTAANPIMCPFSIYKYSRLRMFMNVSTNFYFLQKTCCVRNVYSTLELLKCSRKLRSRSLAYVCINFDQLSLKAA